MATAYIETSVPSYYGARPLNNLLVAGHQLNTRLWWDAGCSGLDLVTSEETFQEASRGHPKRAAERLELLKKPRILAVTSDVQALSDALVERGIVPASVRSDAYHIAIASVHRIDYLVTWNFTHIANPFIQERIREVVVEFGFRMPVMCSPEHLLK